MNENATIYHDEDAMITEMIDGKEYLMSPRPAPGHMTVSTNIHHIFKRFLKGKKCKAFLEVDVHLDEKNTLVPDVLIVCDKNKIKPTGIDGAPDLVVEVLSPATAGRDKGIKKVAYEQAGVKEYWLADPASKSIDVYHLQNGRLEFMDTYLVYPDWEWERMNDEQRASARLSVKVSLYDDLLVDVREVFEDI